MIFETAMAGADVTPLIDIHAQIIDIGIDPISRNFQSLFADVLSILKPNPTDDEKSDIKSVCCQKMISFIGWSTRSQI
jgi:hypothetical protein